MCVWPYEDAHSMDKALFCLMKNLDTSQHSEGMCVPAGNIQIMKYIQDHVTLEQPSNSVK